MPKLLNGWAASSSYVNMRVNRYALVIVAALGLAVSASSQTVLRTHGHVSRDSANMQGIGQVQKDLIAAIDVMKSALPIYDGYRVKSINQTHRGLVMVDRGLYGAQAAKRQIPNVSDSTPSSSAKKTYSATQIATSQTLMKEGLSCLNQAETDLQNAVNGNYGVKGRKLQGFIQQAITDATTAIQIHNH